MQSVIELGRVIRERKTLPIKVSSLLSPRPSLVGLGNVITLIIVREYYWGCLLVISNFKFYRKPKVMYCTYWKTVCRNIWTFKPSKLHLIYKQPFCCFMAKSVLGHWKFGPNALFVCVSVPTEGGGSYSPGPRGSEGHPVTAEIHPGGNWTFFFLNWTLWTLSVHSCVQVLPSGSLKLN